MERVRTLDTLEAQAKRFGLKKTLRSLEKLKELSKAKESPKIQKSTSEAIELKNKIRIIVDIYVSLYTSMWGKLPLSKWHRPKIVNKNAKYNNIFVKIIEFLEDQRSEMNAANTLQSMASDYFSCILNYYKRFNKPPTIYQISPGARAEQLFIDYTNIEEFRYGGYWMSEEDMREAEELTRTGGNKYIDPLIEPILYPNGR